MRLHWCLVALLLLAACALPATPPQRLQAAPPDTVLPDLTDAGNLLDTLPEDIDADDAEAADAGGMPAPVAAEATPAQQAAYAQDTPNVDAGGPMPARPTGTLFYDDFSEGFTDQWEYGENSPVEDDANGNPAPALKLPARAKIRVSSSGLGKSSEVKITTAVEPFSITNGLSISFEVKLPDAPENSLGAFAVALREQDESYPNAAFTIDTNALVYNTRIPYSSTRDDRYRRATGSMIRDTKWHRFELAVDADGTAKWKKDGVTKLTGYLVPGDYLLEIRASPATVTDTQQYYYLLDNVVVRSLGQAPVQEKQPATQPSQQSTYSTSTKGTLSISDDQGYLFVGDSYIGKGRATVSAAPGYYTVSALSPSTSDECWKRSVRVDAGKTTTVKIDSYCR
ncbi:hypothetical protein HY642_05550 [Candidatus Woesearchaeota archaeon]|nr:hypothetical protein [Candidatus Woesearchaeota archaeon]